MVVIGMTTINPDLLKRYTEGSCNAAEQRLVEEWLENNEDFPKDDVDSPSLKKEIWTGLTEKVTKSRTKLKMWYSAAGLVAASLLIFTIIFFFKNKIPAPSIQQTLAVETYQAPKGRMVSLKLDDGTIVQLAGGSTLQFPRHFSGPKREVTLISGEAFFEVKHNKQQPFILHSSGTEVKVLGTRFNFSNNKGTAELAVTLTEGSISFRGKAQSETILKPGQQLIFNKKLNQVQKVEEIDTLYAIGWTTGMLWFKQTPVKEVIEKLEAYYGVTFEIYGNPDLNIPLTAKFQQQPLSRILKLIENSSELKFEQKNKKIMIYKANQLYKMNNKASPQ